MLIWKRIIMKKPSQTAWWLGGIMLAGVLFQLVVLFFLMEPNKLFWYDPMDYYTIASNLAHGLPFSTEDTLQNLYRSPGYPFVLSAMIRIVGTKIISLRLFHIALFPVFLWTLYKLGAFWKGKQVGLVSAAFGIFYPLYIYQPLTLYPESFLLYLFPGIILLTFMLRENMRIGLLVFLSALVTLAILIRPTCIYFIPIILFAIFWQKKWQFKKLAITGSILALIPVLAVSSWMVRNKIVHHHLVFSVAGAEGLLMSYNENATWKHKKVEWPDSVQKRVKNARDFFDKQDILTEEAMKFIKRNPVKSFGLAVFRCFDIWNPIPRRRIFSIKI